MNKLSIKKIIDLCVEALTAERNLSRNTQEAYQRDLCAFVHDMNINNYEHIHKEVINQYLLILLEQKYAVKSIKRKCSAIKQLCTFLHNDKYHSTNVGRDINFSRKELILPRVLSVEEIDKLLRHINHKPEKNNLRLIAMIEIMYSTGMRVSELVSLTVEHLMHAQSYKGITTIFIKGKGNKERLVPLNQSAQKALKDYQEVRDLSLLNQKSKWLFPSRSKEGYITRQRFLQLLKQKGLEIGIPSENISPHVLRHSFASHLLEAGTNLVTIQKLLGHSDLSITQIYTHLNQGKIKDVLEKHHPLSKYP